MLAIKKFQVGHSKNVAIPHRVFQVLGDPEESRLRCQAWESLLFHLLGIIVWESSILTAVGRRDRTQGHWEVKGPPLSFGEESGDTVCTYWL